MAEAVECKIQKSGAYASVSDGVRAPLERWLGEEVMPGHRE